MPRVTKKVLTKDVQGVPIPKPPSLRKRVRLQVSMPAVAFSLVSEGAEVVRSATLAPKRKRAVA